MFNISSFEELLNAGALDYQVRGDILPATETPRWLEPLTNWNVSLTSGGGGITMAMVGMSVGVANRPTEELLDWQVLAKSYGDAYRLAFSRAMVEVLGNNFESPKATIGERQITTEAVVLEPVFIYIVEGLLGVVSIATLALLYLSLTRKRNLRTDPSTIASVMAIIANNQPLLTDFADLDCCTMEDMHSTLGNRRFKLVQDNNGTG